MVMSCDHDVLNQDTISNIPPKFQCMLTWYTHSDTFDILILVITSNGTCSATLIVDHAAGALLLNVNLS